MVKTPPKTKADPRAPAPASCHRGAHEKLLQNPAELERWVRTAQPGTSAIYHTGMLAADRVTRGRVQDIGRAARYQAASGTVLLTQRRISAVSCEYRVTRLARVQPGLGWWAEEAL